LDPAAYLFKGNVLFKWKKNEQAIENYDKTIQKDPNATLAYQSKKVALCDIFILIIK